MKCTVVICTSVVMWLTEACVGSDRKEKIGCFFWNCLSPIEPIFLKIRLRQTVQTENRFQLVSSVLGLHCLLIGISIGQTLKWAAFELGMNSPSLIGWKTAFGRNGLKANF